ncbi:hypothetical protein HHI36_020712 [Cryptolaemus montrouzieri]|uniref:Protein MCM10 homolog n=1 Tax=Cryptolaemus montrouzieri TaxID=559131 RepID=A0ABD2NCP6_9CUCU
MAEDDDLLATLLDVAEAELNSLNNIDKSVQNNSIGTTPKSAKNDHKKLFDVDIFASNLDNKALTPRRKKKFREIEKGLSSIHNGDTDSSDDEGKRNFENQKYNEYGREIKNLINHTSDSNHAKPSSSRGLFPSNSLQTSWKSKSVTNKVKIKELDRPPTNVYTDPIFGISIINPVISSKVLEERMIGRKAIPICQVSRQLNMLGKDEDWVIAGVICNKGVTKTSAKGSQFIIWTLSDLLGDIKTVALFLFGNAYKELWKTQPGTVVGILNPSILDKKEGCRDEATLSVDNAQRIMMLGQSRDLGTCKTVKKNGDKCTSIVNKSKCEFCVYHIKQEYQKCSRRSDLQANFSGKGLIALRNKVLGKNEVFYAGKSYTAIPAKQSKKMMKKDQNRLQSLSGVTNSSVRSMKKPQVRAAESFDVGRSRRLQDMETLRKLGVNIEKYGNLGDIQDFKANHSTSVTMDESKANALKVLAKLKETSNNKLGAIQNEKEKSSNGHDNSQLQRSLDELVQNDLIDLDINYKNTNDYSHDTFVDKVRKNNDLLNCSSTQKNSLSLSEKNVPIHETNLVGHAQTNENLTQPSSKIPDVNKKNYLVFSNSLIMSTTPSLSNSASFIDLNMPIIPRHAKRAKLNAMKFIQKNGPLKKVDPNNTRGTGVKRNLDDLDTNGENTKKLKKIQENEFLSDRFKKMMELQSKHMDLVEMKDNEEKEKYFKKLEVKEQLEEKMANTYKIECKAVRCLNCKYTSFSAADKCKTEKHRLKVYNAFKRFFKCGHCGNRTACLDIVPIHPCKNCGSGNWERTTMMKEKNVTSTVSLSIRGGEQKHLNSIVTDANINLLVPDED